MAVKNKSAPFIILIFYSKHLQNSNFSIWDP